MKANIEAGILALQGFYQVVNTKEKAIMLILLWFLFTASGLTWRFASVDVIERLMKTNCEVNYHRSLERVRELEASSILPEKIKPSIKPMESH